jgi:hypothetical protein
VQRGEEGRRKGEKTGKKKEGDNEENERAERRRVRESRGRKKMGRTEEERRSQWTRTASPSTSASPEPETRPSKTGSGIIASSQNPSDKLRRDFSQQQL